MAARNTLLNINRFRTASARDATRARVLAFCWAPILLCALLLAPLASQAAAPVEGQEVNPSTTIAYNWIYFYHGANNTSQALSCLVGEYETPSSIDCKSYSGGWHSVATMELVGIWHNNSGVTGNRLYAMREARGKTYHYEGVLSPGQAWQGRWIAGSYTVTSWEWKRSGWRYKLVPVIRGPYPFTGKTQTALEG